MIDIRIGMFHSPKARILPEIRFHIFMYFFLQINAEFTVSANHDIGTYASAGRHISIRIVDPHISRIINHTFLRKQKRCIGELLSESHLLSECRERTQTDKNYDYKTPHTHNHNAVLFKYLYLQT